MITNFKLFESKYDIFHCYIPFENDADDTKEIFFLSLEKIDIDDFMRNYIIKYFIESDNRYFTHFQGMFLRFYDDEWDFYEVNLDENIEELSKKLEKTSYNIDNMGSNFTKNRKPNKKSIYTGIIKLKDSEIDFFRNIKKYNL